MPRYGSLAAVLAVTVACAKSETVICDDGTVCAAATKCDPVHGGCISDDQIKACANLGEGDRCMVGTLSGDCRDSVCFPDRCGDGLITGAEQCDGIELGGADCTVRGFYDAAGLACSSSCELDTTA